MPLRRRALLALVSAISFGACGGEPAVGSADQIVIAVTPSLWDEIGARLRVVLEPTPFPLPGEQAFELNHVDPAAETWSEQRRARQLLLIGSAEDPWIAEALERRPGPPPPVPSQTDVGEVWATGQQVLALLLPDDDPRRALEGRLGELRTTYEQRYREYVIGRMFPDGPDQALADSLQAIAGFDLLVPKGFSWIEDRDVHLFRPQEADSSKLMRSVVVAWRSPIPTVRSEALLDWRAQLSATHYGTRQRVNPTRVQGRSTTHRGNVAFQLLGTWTARGASGPFLLRAVICPVQDRMYLLDGWLNAPDQESKEYMVQLESILNSFRCGSALRSGYPSP